MSIPPLEQVKETVWSQLEYHTLFKEGHMTLERQKAVANDVIERMARGEKIREWKRPYDRNASRRFSAGGDTLKAKEVESDATKF